MHSIIMRSFGGPDVLEPADVPRPEPRDGQVLIHVRAAGINPVDAKLRSGKYQRKQPVDLPAVLGRDVAGTIEAVGRNFAGLEVGDEVYAFLATHNGGYAEYAIAEENEVAAKPASLDFVHAAAAPLAATTAWQALFEHGRLAAGQRVLIHGAAGGVGHFAVQFAKAKGATVIATCSLQDLDFVRELGADLVIDYKHERFEDRAGSVDLVIDLIGGETLERSWAVLKRGGTIVSTLEQPSPDKAQAHGAKGIVFSASPRHMQLVEIAELIDAGKVRVRVQHTHSLDEASQAHTELENEHAIGKSVLTVG